MYYNMKNMVTNIFVTIYMTKELYANKHEYFQHLMGVVKCVTQQFIKWGCSISTFYQVIIIWDICVTCTYIWNYEIC